MRFGRVEGLVEAIGNDSEIALRLRVILESDRGITVVRDEIVPALAPIEGSASLSWQADQYTQETIGVDLAMAGWEVIGAGELPVVETGEIARSASYAVRQL
jgi:hypothetical protein